MTGIDPGGPRQLGATFDVVIVGGGIAGSALAAVLAPTGMSVLVLERQVAYRDRVRGENMQPWGAAEAQRLGLEDVFLGAGGGYCSTYVPYDEGLAPADAEANAIPVGLLVPGVPGSLNVGHPQASEALAAAAASRGATVVRGIGDVEVEAGPSPTVRYEVDGDLHEARCRLVVGADGRQSTVRRSLGIVLQQQESKAQLGGLLVEGAHEWPADRAAVGTEGDRHFLAFPRPNGYVRLYLAVDAARDMGGADKASAILEGFRLACVPGSERLADAIPAGPAAFYRGTDTWSDQLAVDGAVLVGDAAGWSDPVIGQGLAVAMRDVRMVADVLRAGDGWSPSAFEPYATERAERMRRLRVSAFVDTELRCTFTPQGQARRRAFRELIATEPLILGVILAILAGPETAPPEAFTDENVARILALAS